jgi:carbonic anhydrase
MMSFAGTPRKGRAMLEQLKANNRKWVKRKAAADPDFFRRLERQRRTGSSAN